MEKERKENSIEYSQYTVWVTSFNSGKIADHQGHLQLIKQQMQINNAILMCR